LRQRLLGGEIPQLIANQKFDEAVARAEKYRDIFGKENFFLEMMDHDLHGQEEVNEKLISIHHKTGIPLIVSNDAHYLRAQDEHMHKISSRSAPTPRCRARRCTTAPTST
jgi:DNA polymerase-3 subunit alpha